jgi:hypothetical protein
MKKFFWISISLTTFLMLLIAAINYVVDPFDIYQKFDLGNLNSNKSGLSRYSRFAKPAIAYQQKPDAVFLGTSRSEYGFSPHLLMELTDKSNAYNLSLAGAGIQEVDLFFKHLVKVTKAKTVVIGLDLFMFNIYKQSSMKPEDLAINGLTSYSLKFYIESLISYSAFRSSQKTISKRNKLSSYIGRGQRSSQKRIDKIISYKNGYLDSFTKTINQFYTDAWFQCGSSQQTGFSITHNGYDTYQFVKNINSLANDHNITLIYVISPNHAHLYEAMSAAGIWDEFIEWKRNLVMIIDNPLNSHATLWDFSGYNYFTVEDLPIDKNKAMKWHLEPSHYTSALGELVLKRIFNDTSSSFGINLVNENIESHITETALQQSLYRSKHPEVYKSYSEMFKLSINNRLQSHRCTPKQI